MNSGQFQPGHQKIPGSGRQKGTPNKPRLTVSHHLATVLENEFEDVADYLYRLKTTRPDDYFAVLIKLLAYTIPRGGMDAVDQIGEADERKQRDEEALERARIRTQEYLARCNAEKAHGTSTNNAINGTP